MKILFIGDIFSSAGRHIVADHLADIRETQKIDVAIANVENAAGGFGVTPTIAEELFALGLDVLTTGNHVWDKKEIYEYLSRRPQLLRPANYADPAPGSGLFIFKARSGVDCAVINLQGRTYMPSTECPFRKADRLLEALADTKVRFVDFHAEHPQTALWCRPARSEEHTSELQSHSDLVCRLLLEKKKKKTIIN